VDKQLDKLAEKQGFYYEKGEADKIIAFVNEYLPAINLCRWQAHVLKQLYGWHNNDGIRRYKTAFIELPKKNGKTLLLAICILYELIRGSECYSAANSRNQAAHIFRELEKLIKSNETLNEYFDKFPSTKTIKVKNALNFYRSLSADMNEEGLNADIVVYDELWLTKDRSLYDVLRFSGDAKPNSVFIVITTAGQDKNCVCYELYQYAKENKTDTRLFSYICEADEKDDWTKVGTWKKANPALGELISLETIKLAYQEAKHSVANENVFRHLRLNQWINIGTSFIDMQKWDSCVYPVDRQSRGADCYAALDLSNRIDITSYTLVFPIYENGELLRYDVIPYFWIPRETAIDREKRESIPYGQWERQKYITITEGNSVDQNLIKQNILEINKEYNVKKIACDPWQAHKVMGEFGDEGYEVVEFRQNVQSYSDPCKYLQSLVLDEQINHFNNPVLRWMAGNMVVKVDHNSNVYPSKQRAINKIDGIITLIMALGLEMLEQQEQGSYKIEWV
jgi:phage terminase large subunit-like protein